MKLRPAQLRINEKAQTSCYMLYSVLSLGRTYNAPYSRQWQSTILTFLFESLGRIMIPDLKYSGFEFERLFLPKSESQ